MVGNNWVVAMVLCMREGLALLMMVADLYCWEFQEFVLVLLVVEVLAVGLRLAALSHNADRNEQLL